MRIKVYGLWTLLLLLILAAGDLCRANDLTLWFTQPANKVMEEALPIGNGRLGALIMGNPSQERLIINEDSLWTGDDNPSGKYESMGAYQLLGNLEVNLPSHQEITDYRRDLNLTEAIATVSYKVGKVQYHREYFSSAVAQCLVSRFTADQPGALTGSIELVDGHQAKVELHGNLLSISGKLDNGLAYAWRALVVNQGGKLNTNGDKLEFKDCDSLTILLAAGTNYLMDADKGFRGGDPQPLITKQLADATSLSYEQLKAAHVQDFQSLFNRVAIDLGKASDEQKALPTDQRKLQVAKTPDPGLDALLFQYGRYLLISCSRPGGLPANLQGLWNDSNKPMWSSDYHANINVQMNYWPAEVTNLSECHLPFLNLIVSQLPLWRKATQASQEMAAANGEKSQRGWALRTSHNIFGGSGWQWDKAANAWYASHFWEHFAFTQDKQFLQTTAYPVIKELCEFWEDHLCALPDGRLVVPKGWSPEHGPKEDGVAYNQQIVWNLFNNYVAASEMLGIDADYRAKIAAMRDKLAGPKVGSWGQLLEWLEEKKGDQVLDTPNDHHRHTSHLFAVFPGQQISPEQTPELAAAAKVSLDARGIDEKSDVREWSFAWRAALYARLKDAPNAYLMLRNMFTARNTCPNLFGLHPPMQIDGNFGISAGIAEMLLQSRQSPDQKDWEIELLPALPNEWPDGSVQGLKARGGFEVGMTWQAGKLTSVTVKNIAGATTACRVNYHGQTVVASIAQGESKSLNANLQ
jgi:alpha-L-fucosidase 2